MYRFVPASFEKSSRPDPLPVCYGNLIRKSAAATFAALTPIRFAAFDQNPQ